MKKILFLTLSIIFFPPVIAESSLSGISDATLCSWFEVANPPQAYVYEAKRRNLACAQSEINKKSISRVKFKIDCGKDLIQTSKGCEKIPANAFKLGYSFDCEVGFKKINERCEAITLPENAVFSLNQDGWACEEGFFRTSNNCNKIQPKLPPNAFKIGDSFRCSSGYYKDNNSCIKLPPYAFANDMSDGFYCIDRYTKNAIGNRCVIEKPQITENKTSDIWNCGDGFERVNNDCIQIPIFKEKPEFLKVFYDNSELVVFLWFKELTGWLFNDGKPTMYFWLALIFGAIALDNISSLRRKRKEKKEFKKAELENQKLDQRRESAKVRLDEAKRKQEIAIADAKLKKEKSEAEEKRKLLEQMKNAEAKRIHKQAEAKRKKDAEIVQAKQELEKENRKAQEAELKRKKEKAEAEEKLKLEEQNRLAKEAKEKLRLEEEERKNTEAELNSLFINEDSDKSEILNYAKALTNKSLRDIISKIQESNLEDQYYSYRRYFPFEEDRGLMVDVERVCEKTSNKGSIFEELLDKYAFNIDSDNQSANHLAKKNLFLNKIPATIGTKYIFLNNLRLSPIDYYEIIDEIWENSSMYNELQNLLIVIYKQLGYSSPLDYKVIGVKSPNLIEDLPEYLLNQIKKDWESIRDKVKDGRAHFITDRQTKYLIAQNDDRVSSAKVRQPNNSNKANSKIFCLKKEFINIIFAVESLPVSQIKIESDSVVGQSVVFTKLDKDGKRKEEVIPKLEPSGRDREFKKYELSARSSIVKDFLFDGIGHRELDANTLGLDPKQSKGFQSMGILHYLGLKKPFSGLFYNLSVERVNELLNEDLQDFGLILEHINFLEESSEEQDIFNVYHPYYEFHKDFNTLFYNHLGKSEEEIAEFLNISLPSNKPKNFRRVLVDNIVRTYGQHIDQTDRVIKVIKLESSGKLTQSIPLPTFKYLDIVNEEWGASDLFKQLTQYFTFIVFKEEEDSNSSTLLKVLSWTISTEDLREAQKVWEETVSQINLKKADELPKISESNVLHVRPHAQNKMDTFPTHYGEDVIKKSFWLNAKFIETIVRDYD